MTPEITNPMNFEAFENDSQIKELLRPLIERSRRNDIRVSDIIQKNGGQTYQYVDLVMEGGGVLGVALLGYIYALEEMGIRFLSIGGTSAGSIVALLLMAYDQKQNKKARTLTEIVANKNFGDFIDGDSDAADFSKLFANGSLSDKKFAAIFKGMQVIDNIVFDLGLNPGKHFFEWIHKQLESFEAGTLTKLNEKISEIPNGLENTQDPESKARIPCFLGIVAADVTTETKVVFPEMAGMYWKNPDEVSPANFVRASMSIPFFFHPFKVTDVPGNGPNEVFFIDGGTMSNFPISIFHEADKVPAAPTFGIKLGNKKRTHHKITGVGSLLSAIFNSSRHYADYDFLMKNKDYNNLIGYVDTDAYNWLDFNMTDETKLNLFREGVKSACNFVAGFKWEDYKKIRGEQVSAAAK